MDLNADLGEHDGDGYASDFALLDVVTSASIACGAHAGSEAVMRKTAGAAAERGVAIGAHPGYRDRAGFGRRDTAMPESELGAEISAQITALATCCAEVGAKLRYVKPHGALYNSSVRGVAIAHTIVRAVHEVDPSLIVLALAGSALAREATAAGMNVAMEAFIDRAYMDDGSLVPRGQDGAVLDDPNAVGDRALAIAQDRKVLSIDGSVIAVDADSLCIHGDGVNALAMATAVRSRLEQAGFACAPFAR